MQFHLAITTCHALINICHTLIQLQGTKDSNSPTHSPLNSYFVETHLQFVNRIEIQRADKKHFSPSVTIVYMCFNVALVLSHINNSFTNSIVRFLCIKKVKMNYLILLWGGKLLIKKYAFQYSTFS